MNMESLKMSKFFKKPHLSLAFSLFASLNLILLSPKLMAEEDGMGAVDYSDRSEGSTKRVRNSDSSKPKIVGRKAAQKFMGQKSPEAEATSERSPASSSSDAHYLAIHFGSFLGDDSYKWGSDHETNTGKFNMGVTYRLGEWVHSADFAFRIDFMSYSLSSGTANKLSLLPAIIFPDSSSHFPIYFGAAVGPGFYLKQISGQSPISIDYQIFLGARFFNLIQNTGFFVEAGLKDHIHLLSNGQFNGSFVALGALFTF